MLYQTGGVGDRSSPLSEGRQVLPFLKWAGGKRWLVALRPDIFPTEYRCYLEPFLGSGAVFFYLNPRQAVLSDVNPELINVYGVIKDDWVTLEDALERHENRHSDEYYYELRSQRPRTLQGRAARFLYLNRTCWNGLYRENKLGQFNVPRGTKNEVILDTDDFGAISERLGTADLSCCDFEVTVNKAQCDDFLFVDPPYTVKHNTNGFIKYNQNIFSWADQIRLRDALLRARGRGVKLLLTNAAHHSVIDLYKDFDQLIVGRRSVLAADSAMRTATEELLVFAN